MRRHCPSAPRRERPTIQHAAQRRDLIEQHSLIRRYLCAGSGRARLESRHEQLPRLDPERLGDLLNNLAGRPCSRIERAAESCLADSCFFAQFLLSFERGCTQHQRLDVLGNRVS